MVLTRKEITSRVFFRVDGGPLLGWGHLYRCLALAEMLDLDFEIFFLLRDAPQPFIKELRLRKFSYYTILTDHDWLILLNERDIVVLDGYDFSTGFQSEIRKKSKLVCIDDLHDKIFDADLIINHCPGVQKLDYKTINESIQFALGLDYVLLRKQFLVGAQKAKRKQHLNNLMICFGGADPQNLTERCLDKVSDNPSINHIDVIVGDSYQFEESLQKYSDNRITIYKALSADEMVNKMQENSFAIVSSSGILFESIAMKLACLSLAYVDNQRKIFNGFKEMNLIYPVEDINCIDQNLKMLLNANGYVRDSVIDGLSGQRLLSKLKSLVS